MLQATGAGSCANNRNYLTSGIVIGGRPLFLEDAREKVEVWREEYNMHRPHGALDNLAPVEFVKIMELVS